MGGRGRMLERMGGRKNEKKNGRKRKNGRQGEWEEEAE